MTKSETILELFKENPNFTASELAEQVGCSKRYARRIINPIRKKDTSAVVKPTSMLPARILLLDIETSPMECFAWRLWKQNIMPHQIIKDWSILTWAAKWFMEPTIFGDRVTGSDACNRVDTALMQDLWDLMEQADIIVAHNGNKFDVPRINTRLLLNGYKPYHSPRFVDTMAVLKRTFQVSSMKMDEVNRSLGILEKMEHEGMGMWKKAVSGTNEADTALDKMLEYNKVDVLALEELYITLRPWIRSHPNVNLFMDILEDDQEIRCTHCGGDDLRWDGRYYTPAGRYNAFRCNACGAIGRSRYSDLTLEERKTLGIATAN